ncbi:MAG: hypothetical protein AB2614_00690 [Candidatus Thiodiazotropha endolucinida]|nr:hypothetical protein [Candidatus Thiodiazotropha taylori]MCW4246956.1 hypothetical protein [Candidatus Thiodiazotropha endolucinida]MCG7889957.1 hypothetical protein [Candidatus Thiodiazotropha taylori]MCG7950832.1 hypothetical protein [Candidatus Thiodiazotropha taylori]MCG8103686.1 hypothetical protein [Candidatus Thiodiazotropha taylori]
MRLRNITTICLTLFILGNSQAEIEHAQRSNRQMAVTVCNDYRETNRLPCFVSRKEYPGGFEVIERFANSTGPSYSACRDKRHERPRHYRSSSRLYNTNNQQLLDQFKRLIGEIERHQTGAPAHLPQASQDKLAVFFSGIDLSRIRLAHSKALTNGCFTDCRMIFCASKDQVDVWTNPHAPVLTIRLLHQLAHAERCEIQGGQHRFVQTWLRHLPEDVLTALERGEPIDTKKIHFAIYMETHANNRAESICRRVRCIKD